MFHDVILSWDQSYVTQCMCARLDKELLSQTGTIYEAMDQKPHWTNHGPKASLNKPMLFDYSIFLLSLSLFLHEWKKVRKWKANMNTKALILFKVGWEIRTKLWRRWRKLGVGETTGQGQTWDTWHVAGTGNVWGEGLRRVETLTGRNEDVHTEHQTLSGDETQNRVWKLDMKQGLKTGSENWTWNRVWKLDMKWGRLE